MNWDRIEGNWKELRGKARENWGELTDDDLDIAELDDNDKRKKRAGWCS